MCFSPTEKVTENVALKKAIDMLIDTRTWELKIKANKANHWKDRDILL
jgi:hypothetical protein